MLLGILWLGTLILGTLYLYLFSTYNRGRKGVNLCRLPKTGRDVPLKDGLGHEGLLLDWLVDEGGGILQLRQLSLFSSESTIISGYRTPQEM